MIPTQMNCAHSDEGWCLGCVRQLQAQHNLDISEIRRQHKQEWDEHKPDEWYEQEIARLKSTNSIDKNYIRLDDPVVTGLVDALEGVVSSGRNHGNDPITREPCGCEDCENYFAIDKALSAYEARVKEVEK